ncbi:MAG: hypothetical protein WD875_14680 [Pirellulales bacterium]
MKVFDLEKLNASYRFKIWDREWPDWKDFARANDLKVAMVKEPELVSVMKRIELTGKKRQSIDEIGYLLSEAPDADFEGGARLKKRPKTAKAAAG